MDIRYLQNIIFFHFLFAYTFQRFLSNKNLAVCPVNAQQEYIGENRRRGSVDEDIGDYIYADYDAGNGLLEREPERPGPLPVDPPRSRIPQLPKRNNNPNPYQDFRRPSNSGLLQGRDACKSGAKSVAHEDQCDLYYECYEGQGFLTSCPNGLVYGGEGRFGLIGMCDYPHNVNCQGRDGKSKKMFLFLLHAN